MTDTFFLIACRAGQFHILPAIPVNPSPRVPPLLYLVEDDPGAMVAYVTALGRRGSRLAFLGASSLAESALVAVEYTQVDLVLADWNLPGMDGIELTTRIKQLSPATRVLLVTGFYDDAITRHALAAGVDGLLHKPFELAALCDCVRTVLAGHRVLSDRATGHLLTPPAAEGTQPVAGPSEWAKLSPTQREVMARLVRGLVLKEVAAQLGLSFYTADTHRRRAYRKLRVHTLPEAIRKLPGPPPGN